MCIAVGIATAVAGIAGAGATVYAANKAAGATGSATNAAIASQQQALAQQATLSQPYRDLGQSAISQYQNLLGIGPQGQAGIQQTLQNLPGYKFTQQQGADATKAQFGAMGLGLSGNTLQGLNQFNTGLADQTYGAEVQRLLQPVQLGQASAAGQAANIGQAGTNISNLISGQGQTQAGIYANTAASLAGIAGGAANNYAYLNTLQNLKGTPAATYDPGMTMGAGSSGIIGYNPGTDPGMVYPG
jgi:hypothetical protein